MERTNKTITLAGDRYCFDGVSLKNGRPVNMDSLVILNKSIGSNQLLLAAVSDGVGSLDHGAYAATALTRGLLGWFSTLRSCENLADELRTEILAINREIASDAAAGDFQTAATVSVLLLVNDHYIIFNAGDSRVYLLQDQTLTQITEDDVSPTGGLTEYIGFPEPPNLHLFQGTIGDGLFLLCSDGLTKRAEPEYLLNRLMLCTDTQIRNTLDSLANYVIQRGETDNITIAVVTKTHERNAT